MSKAHSDNGNQKLQKARRPAQGGKGHAPDDTGKKGAGNARNNANNTDTVSKNGSAARDRNISSAKSLWAQISSNSDFFSDTEPADNNKIPRHHMYAIWSLVVISLITAIFLPTPEEISNRNEYSWESTGRHPDIHNGMSRNIFSEEDVNATETLDSDPIPFSDLYDEDENEKSGDNEWFTQTVVPGDNINNIFMSLNQPFAVLKAIEQVPQYGSNIRSIKPKDKLYFLFNDKMQILQLVKPYDRQNQLRFSRQSPDSLDFTVVLEPIDSHLNSQNDDEIKSTTEIAVQPKTEESGDHGKNETQQTKTEQPKDQQTAAAEKDKQDKEAEKKAQELARQKAEAEAKRKAEEKRLAEEKARRDLLNRRKELVTFTINKGDTFVQAAQRAGLTKAEAIKITELYRGRMQPKHLRPGDEIRVLFASSKPNSKINAVTIKSQKNGRMNAFRDTSNNSYYDDKGIHARKSTKFNRYPVAGPIRVTSNFNPNRRHPITGKVRPHNGTDFGVKVGTPIFAPADGIVTKATFQRAAGNYIVIQHRGDYSTVYMHLSKILVKPGQKVKANDRIALSGNTGASTGPHLHYEVRIKGVPVNALKVSLPNSGYGGDSATEKRLKAQIAEYKRKLGIN